jgi:hypothetical protein
MFWQKDKKNAKIQKFTVTNNIWTVMLEYVRNITM